MSMKSTHYKAVLAAALLSLGIACCLWLHAEEKAPSSDSSSLEKLATIDQNNQDITKSLEAVEENLNFIKARAMRGGRQP